MLSEHEEFAGEAGRSQSSSATAVPRETRHCEEKVDSPSPDATKEEDFEDFENLNYPRPWKFEKWFLGGYSQKRMMKFKNPKTMYYAINLFAGMDFDTYCKRLGACADCSCRRCCHHVLRL